MPFSSFSSLCSRSCPSERPRLLALSLLVLLLSGCLPGLPQVSLGDAPAFDAVAFFSSRTTGLGTLTIRTRSPQMVRVESVGTVDAAGTLTLVQLVRLGDEPAKERRWRLRRDGPARWVGTLTDASGPVEAWAEGNRLHIRYPIGRGLSMAQEVTLQPGGRLALNLATVRFWGLPIARLSEQIQRGSL